MADTITKILIRQGTDVQRRTANITGIVFSSGEPAYCVDTKRLFIGDGSTSGGNAIGIQNIGSLDTLYGNYQGGLSFDAVQAFLNKGAAVGDIVYDEDTRGLYALTSVSTFPPLSSDLVKFDFVTLINTSQFEYNASKQLQIKNQGVGPRQLSFSVADGYTIGKASLDAPLALIEGSVENRFLSITPPNSLKGNFTTIFGAPTDLQVLPGTVVGRTNTSELTCFTFDVILQQASFAAENGITINQSITPPVFALDTTKFTVATNSITLKKNTSITGSLNVTSGDVTVTGNVKATADIIAYFSSDKTLKENLKPIDNSLEKLLKISGYSFDWKNVASEYRGYEHLQGSDVGVIAQEVEAIIPEAVQTREDGIKAVNYQKIIPLLIESIKELKNEINELKEKKCCHK